MVFTSFFKPGKFSAIILQLSICNSQQIYDVLLHFIPSCLLTLPYFNTLVLILDNFFRYNSQPLMFSQAISLFLLKVFIKFLNLKTIFFFSLSIISFSNLLVYFYKVLPLVSTSSLFSLQLFFKFLGFQLVVPAYSSLCRTILMWGLYHCLIEKSFSGFFFLIKGSCVLWLRQVSKQNCRFPLVHVQFGGIMHCE